jgi:DNA mismatch repair protein MutS
VAKLAGLPESIIKRAQVILRELEDHHTLKEPQSKAEPEQQTGEFEKVYPRTVKKPKAGFQLPIMALSEEWLKQELLALDLDRITPLAALQILYAIQERLKKEKGS